MAGRTLVSVGFTDNTGKLRQLATSLRAMPRALRREVAERTAVGWAGLVDDQFARASGPGGAHWKPPADGHRPPMQRTRRLRHGFTFHLVPTGRGVSVKIGNDRDYARWLQSGTPRMERRQMVPDAGKRLPQDWAKVAEDAYALAARRYWESRRVR